MNSWIDTTKSLPVEHESVRFVVVGHTRALTGVYENNSFCSRWGAYDKKQVGIWHKLGDVPAPPRTNPDLRCGSDRPMRESC